MVNLHVHSMHSRLDGLASIDQILDRVKVLGQEAVAITDHGEMSGAIPLLLASKGKDVKPIIGYEAYMVENRKKTFKKEKRFHLILLAENIKGYQNLIKMASEAYITGFYNKPRIDWSLLEEYNDGLLASTACLGGMVPQAIMGNIGETPEAVIKRYLEIFDKRFWIELIPFQDPKQKPVNIELVNLAKKYKLPYIITGDCHYIMPEDFVLHDFLLAVQTNAKWDDPKRFSFKYPDFYIRDDADIKKALDYLHHNVIKSGLKQTEEIAARVDDLRQKMIEIPSLEFELPNDDAWIQWKKDHNDVVSDHYEDTELYFRYLIEKGAKEKLDRTQHNFMEYVERLNYEFDTIKQRDFIDYFLVVHDYISWARDNGILVGPARGSAAGSLIAYLMGITEIDPIKNDLMFERFIAPGRNILPDIDTDFQHDRRDEVKEYLAEKYGEENVASIASYTEIHKRSAIKDAARVLGKSAKSAEFISNIIMDEISGAEDFTFKEMFTDQDFFNSLKNKLSSNFTKKKTKQVDDDHAEVMFGDRTDFFLKMIAGLEGVIRSWSKHPAGVVLSSSPIVNVVPLRKIKDAVTTANNMYELEELGLLKLDILGIKTLTTIQRTFEYINKNQDGYQLEVNWREAEKDEKVWDLICRGETIGLFQLETPIMTDLVKRMKPRNIKELSDAVALVRPGPYKSGLTESYLRRKEQKEVITYDFPQLEEILDKTYGTIIYQEQVIQLVQLLADYTPEEADNLRRIIGKKKQKEMMDEEYRFLSRMEAIEGKKGGGEKANNLWRNIVTFGGYAFNKAHATSYATLAFRTAWLKAYYPVEFMTALLNVETANQAKFLEECRRMGIELALPDINMSGIDFKITGKNQIRFGLTAIMNVGMIAATEIVNKQPYKDTTDFLERVSSKVNKRVIEALIAAGAFDKILKSNDRLKILKGYYDYRGIKEIKVDQDYSDNVSLELEFLGMPISESPKEKWADILRKNSGVSNEEEWIHYPLGRPIMISGTFHNYKMVNSKNGKRQDFALSTIWGGYIYISSFHKTDISHLENKAVVVKVQKSQNYVNMLEIWDVAKEMSK